MHRSDVDPQHFTERAHRHLSGATPNHALPPWPGARENHLLGLARLETYRFLTRDLGWQPWRARQLMGVTRRTTSRYERKLRHLHPNPVTPATAERTTTQ